MAPQNVAERSDGDDWHSHRQTPKHSGGIEPVGARGETILFIEKGEHNPPLKLAHDIAKAVKTTIDDPFIFDD